MNRTETQGTPTQGTPTQGTPTQGTPTQGTMREMWETRPTRPQEGRQLAGVAAAIARRYDIDPVLVRIGFVVAAFYGIGAVLYIAGWILLPEEPANPATPAPARSTRVLAVIGLLIAIAVSLDAVFHRDTGIVLPALAAVALLLLLHHSRADRGPGGSASADPAVTAAVPAGPPLVTVPREPAARGLPVTSVTLGLMLLAGGTTALILLLAGALSWANLPLLFGVALAVLGSGLVVGAFVRSGRGLIPIAVLLGVMTWGVLVGPPDRWRAGDFDDLRVRPTTVVQLLPNYQRTVGEIDMDLRFLDLTVRPGGDAAPARSSVSVGAGEVRLWVPRDADLTFTGSVGAGRLMYGDRVESGPGARIEVPDDLGADGVRSGRQLIIDITAGTGNVEVRRG